MNCRRMNFNFLALGAFENLRFCFTNGRGECRATWPWPEFYRRLCSRFSRDGLKAVPYVTCDVNRNGVRRARPSELEYVGHGLQAVPCGYDVGRGAALAGLAWRCRQDSGEMGRNDRGERLNALGGFAAGADLADSAPTQPSADRIGATTAPLELPGRARTICSVPERYAAAAALSPVRGTGGMRAIIWLLYPWASTGRKSRRWWCPSTPSRRWRPSPSAARPSSRV